MMCSRFDEETLAEIARFRRDPLFNDLSLDVVVTRLIDGIPDTVTLVKSARAFCREIITWGDLHLPLTKTLDSYRMGLSVKLPICLTRDGSMVLDFEFCCDGLSSRVPTSAIPSKASKARRVLGFLHKYLPWNDMPLPRNAQEAKLSSSELLVSPSELLARLKAVKRQHDSGHLNDSEYAALMSSLLV